jgi:hypothetical protein
VRGAAGAAVDVLSDGKIGIFDPRARTVQFKQLNEVRVASSPQLRLSHSTLPPDHETYAAVPPRRPPQRLPPLPPPPYAAPRPAACRETRQRCERMATIASPGDIGGRFCSLSHVLQLT